MGVDPDKVVVDVVLRHEPSGLLPACECKSGANVEARQAQKYAGLDGATLAQAASVDVTATRPTVAVVYVCLAEHVSRIQRGLTAAGVTALVLAIARDEVKLLGSTSTPARLADASPSGRSPLAHGVRRITRLDHESPAEVVESHVRAVLVGHLTRRTETIETAPIGTPPSGSCGRRRITITVGGRRHTRRWPVAGILDAPTNPSLTSSTCLPCWTTPPTGSTTA